MKNRTVITSLLWKLMERFGTQGISFIVGIVLARLLLPSDYGVVALLTIFINIATIFVQSGFNTALIQRTDADETDFSSVFYLSLSVAGLLYVIFFICAPLISLFYSMPILTPIMRVLSITLFFGAFNSIQNAKIAREMQFKKLFVSSFGAIILSGIVGIVMAYFGYGAWAIVAQQLTNQVSICIIMWFTVKWRPRKLISLTRLKVLFSYGSKLLISSLLVTVYQELTGLVVGKKYTSTMLGYYNRGKQFPQLIIGNIDGAIQSVMLPAISNEQDNRQRVKSMVRRSIVTSSYIIFPIMTGLAVAAKPIVVLLLTEKWLACVPFMQIFCLSYVLWPIHTANLQAINAVGRSDIFLKLEIIKDTIGIVILCISVFVFNSAIAIAWSTVISGVIGMIINAYPNKRLLNYSLLEQLIDIIPAILFSAAMGAAAWSVQLLNLNVWCTLIIQIVIGFTIYVSLSWIFKLECFKYLLGIVKELFNRKGNKKLI